MSNRLRRSLYPLRLLADLTLIGAGWILAYYIRFTFFVAPKGIPEPSLYFKLLPFIVVIWFSTFSLSGFYRRTGRHRTAFLEGIDIIQCCLLATAALIAFTYFYEEYRYSRLTVGIFGALHPWLIMGGRSLIRKLTRRRLKNAPERHILIIGDGTALDHALEKGSAGWRSRPANVTLMIPGQDEAAATRKQHYGDQGYRIREVPDNWTDYFTSHPTESVLVALPHQSYSFLENHLDTIANQVTDIRLIPDILKYTRFSAGIEMEDGVPVISIHESPLAGTGRLIKRSTDILGSLAAILLLSPLMLIIAILVPLTSRGGILYRQERMGIDGKRFECLKFRSMPEGVERETGAVFARAGESRATPFGELLRRTSLDELPQLFNVLRGDMSLVGPRPERPVFVNQFRRDVPGYMLRHKVRAGITGWAQVNGWRGNTSIPERIEHDLYYIQNWSFWFDMKILIMTIEEVFRGKNAY